MNTTTYFVTKPHEDGWGHTCTSIHSAAEAYGLYLAKISADPISLPCDFKSFVLEGYSALLSVVFELISP